MPPSISTYQKYLLVGPTGAGKSTFIEALANDRTMGISKDQLEGFTQALTAYEVVNVHYYPDDSICLLDVPGFSDTNLSEIEILEMVKTWMKDNDVSSLESVIYFCPITDTRLPGSRRKTIEMFKALVQSSSRPGSGSAHEANEGTVMIVTTMWDQLQDHWHNRQMHMEKAEANYAYLEDTIWKDMIKKGARITKFTNTQRSALDILELGRRRWGLAYGNAYRLHSELNVPLNETTYGGFLYQDLMARMESARQARKALEFAQYDLDHDVDEPELVEAEIKRIEVLLQNYEQQLKILGGPPKFQPESEPCNQMSCSEDGPASSTKPSQTPPQIHQPETHSSAGLKGRMKTFFRRLRG
ncbi:hypothetical protein CVT24_013346 [Panaeolus cyanescens]|uniref:G domain-containing protein n=1 Tax=Panaeolus cyanescens TaxID=181874 RepID=A0A409YMK7_9AGAR|nr:hypothetical protein CVT24_013346 [Panaeolus cyanescens]